MASPNVVWHKAKISRADRTRLLGRGNRVLWFTGLSGSGKSTVAHELEKELHKRGVAAYVLDGDNIRHGLNSDLGFSQDDRNENIRRIGEVARLFYDAGLYVLVCFISPYEKERKSARKLIGKDFIEIFVDCPFEVCEKRDTKGMYKKAREGKIKGFTGIDDPYEEPKHPEIRLSTAKEGPARSVEKILAYLNI